MYERHASTVTKCSSVVNILVEIFATFGLDRLQNPFFSFFDHQTTTSSSFVLIKIHACPPLFRPLSAVVFKLYNNTHVMAVRARYSIQ